MKLLKLVTTAIVLVSFGVVFAKPVQSIAQDRVNTIAVTGTGRISVAPDMAMISVGVLREAKTARDALSANNEAMGSVLEAMKTQGIEEKDLQTSNFNIQPRYFYPKRKANGEQPAPQITGYVVSNNLDIRIRDLEQTGEILDLVVTLGVNSGGNIRFMNEDTSKILNKARTAAVEDAISKAMTLADAAQVELGDILNISENSVRPGPVPLAQARAATIREDAPSSVPISGGENTYKVDVQISWEIEQ
ncbi:MAG: SIMPL domain-containing protein [Pseudomonadota bacterium]